MKTPTFVAAADRSAGAGWPPFRFGLSRQRVAPTRIYRITDRLREWRTVRVPGDRIGCAVSAWLAELGVDSPMVNDLARAVCSRDWPAAHVIDGHLSVDVAIAA